MAVLVAVPTGSKGEPLPFSFGVTSHAGDLAVATRESERRQVVIEVSFPESALLAVATSAVSPQIPAMGIWVTQDAILAPQQKGPPTVANDRPVQSVAGFAGLHASVPAGQDIAGLCVVQLEWLPVHQGGFAAPMLRMALGAVGLPIPMQSATGEDSLLNLPVTVQALGVAEALARLVTTMAISDPRQVGMGPAKLAGRDEGVEVLGGRRNRPQEQQDGVTKYPSETPCHDQPTP